MLDNISWGNYITAISFLSLAYYAVVLFIFYAPELRSSLVARGRRSINEAPATGSAVEEEGLDITASGQHHFVPSESLEGMPAETVDTTMQQVQKLSHRLKEAVAEAAEEGYVREEFILSLQLVLKKFPLLKDSPYVPAINDLIASECEKYGYLQLSAEDRVMLWKE